MNDSTQKITRQTGASPTSSERHIQADDSWSPCFPEVSFPRRSTTSRAEPDPSCPPLLQRRADFFIFMHMPTVFGGKQTTTKTRTSDERVNEPNTPKQKAPVPRRGRRRQQGVGWNNYVHRFPRIERKRCSALHTCQK